MLSSIISTLRTSDKIKPRNGIISFGFSTGKNQLSKRAQQNIRYIFDSLIEPFINVRFVENKNGKGDINFQLNASTSEYAYEKDGSIFLSRRYDNSVSTNGFQGGFGTNGFETLLHEILHSLGMKHPGRYKTSDRDVNRGPYLSYARDNHINTVMSYNTAGEGASSLMPFDILTLQSMYGKRRLNPRNTTYKFDSVYSFSDGSRRWGNSRAPSKLTFADDSGYDTLDFTQLSLSPFGYYIDARRGGIVTTVFWHNGSSYVPKDRDKKITSTERVSRYGTRLSLTTNIERIIGSTQDDEIRTGDKSKWVEGYRGDDIIYGNRGSEVLFGGIGLDKIYGEGGDDLLFGGNGGARESDPGARDILYGGQGKDKIYGEGGNDALYGQDGNDIIYGGSGNDYIAGTSEARTRDRDTLYGGKGEDVFVFADKNNLFYQGSGYAVIKDWEAGRDKIQLGRGEYIFGTKRLLGGTAVDGVVYYKQDLIGVVEDIGNSGLSRSDFVLA